MQPERYLQRIRYSGPLEPTLEVLRELHRAHMLSVPFENLDIPAKRPIVLQTPRLLHKVVDLRRGGFCYELNGAFAWLLQQAGFELVMLAARVGRRDGSFGPEFDHMALDVRDINHNHWLADVGFGDCFLEPLSLDELGEFEQRGRTYRLIDVGGPIYLQRKSVEENWTTQYEFTRKAHALDEFSPMCDFHQSSPESFFTQRRVCSMATPEGRITLENFRLITTLNGEKTETAVASEEEFQRLLCQHFGIKLK